MCYYLVKWLSESYTLHADTKGMSGIISAGKMVVNALYFNPVHRAQNWYTPSDITTVVEVKHILRTGLQVQSICTMNALPRTCASQEATRKKAVKVSSVDHEAIMEEASKRDRLEYDNNDDDKDQSEEDSNEESKENESKLESN